MKQPLRFNARAPPTEISTSLNIIYSNLSYLSRIDPKFVACSLLSFQFHTHTHRGALMLIHVHAIIAVCYAMKIDEIMASHTQRALCWLFFR